MAAGQKCSVPAFLLLADFKKATQIGKRAEFVAEFMAELPEGQIKS